MPFVDIPSPLYVTVAKSSPARLYVKLDDITQSRMALIDLTCDSDVNTADILNTDLSCDADEVHSFLIQ